MLMHLEEWHEGMAELINYELRQILTTDLVSSFLFCENANQITI